MNSLMPAIVAILIATASAVAQPAIQSPRIGFAIDNNRSMRPVYGVAGNFILGPSLSGDAISGSFSGTVGLLKTDSTLLAIDAQGQVLATTDTAPGPALFAFSEDGLSAIAYVENGNTLLEWREGGFTTIPFRPATSATEIVLSIALRNRREVSLIVQRPDGIWQVELPFHRARVVSQKAVVGVTAPLLALASGDVVYTDANGVVLRKPDGSEVHIAGPLPAKFSLQQMDREWLELSDADTAARFAIRISPGRESLYQLPESSQ